MKSEIATDNPVEEAAPIRESSLRPLSAHPPADRLVIASHAPDLRIMRFFNPLILAILRSPLQGLLSAHILLLTYTGRRSGRQYTLPVGYVRDGDALLVVSQHSELKRWWRNLRGGAPVAVLVGGKRVPARAEVMEDPADVAIEVERLIARLGAKEASRQLYMSLDAAPRASQQELAQALHGVVVVRITPERAPISTGVHRTMETQYVEQPAAH